ncbi:MAG TPA: hypothetical protein VEQ15_10310 [Myxococcales bacterium]|jgi:hypothetical protein|nr:hypothetical protein [Myxococcales bacterium]
MSSPSRIEALVAAIEGLDPVAQAHARELLGEVLEMHRQGLTRIAGTLAGAGLLDGLALDPAVSALLLLHDLHPLGLEDRARAAVDHARAQLAVHGCTVDLLGVTDGIVRVALERRVAGGLAAAEELRVALRDAVLAEAPDAAEVLVEGKVEPGRSEAPLVQLRAVAGRP